MNPAFIDSRTSIRLKGTAVPGATDRQEKIAGFDQAAFSAAHVLCIGAGGLISHIAPTLARKGIGRITLIDADVVEPSNLNRQRFYAKDIGRNKALALAENLVPECITGTEIVGHPYRLEEAIALGTDLRCDVAVCGVDNNPARVAAAHFFRSRAIPVIFTAVSQDADHGYVFVQESCGPCIACVMPDMTTDDRQPCPGTPAIADILQAVGSLAVVAVDTIITGRNRTWNYRTIRLSDFEGARFVTMRHGCHTGSHDRAPNGGSLVSA